MREVKRGGGKYQTEKKYISILSDRIRRGQGRGGERKRERESESGREREWEGREKREREREREREISMKSKSKPLENGLAVHRSWLRLHRHLLVLHHYTAWSLEAFIKHYFHPS